jgi:3-hydroxybutyryl-CoA dehydrogenase
MRLAVLANEELKKELLSCGIAEDCIIDWVSSANELKDFSNADAVIDLLFEENGYSTTHLSGFFPRPVIINCVSKTTAEIGLPVMRINGWPGFLQRKIVEAASANSQSADVEKIFSLLNRKTEWVPDEKGFISARVVSMIINEAFFALEENVSGKVEIDTAMKLGTNYPFGPFEWAKKIGLKNIAELLMSLSEEESRYQPSGLLIKEAKEK